MALNQAFTNFLGNTGETTVRDYQHASQLYVSNNYAKAPKVGFLYFITFSINTAVPLDAGWQGKEVGLLVKKIDLPKFNLKTETINQYNRKTIVQTGLTYTNINVEFHDDNSNLTRDLWTNYYRYYFMDSTYGTGEGNVVPPEFKDTKYNANDYSYGLDSYQSAPFFDSINIYVLHQQKFTQYTLVNPMVENWTHDNLDQDQGGKILANKMTVAYESVLYNKGQIVRGTTPEGFGAQYYDQAPSPLAVAGKNSNGIPPAGSSAVFGTPPGPSQTVETPVNRFSNNRRQSGLVDRPQNIEKYDNNSYSVLDGVLGNLQSAGAENNRIIPNPTNTRLNPNSNITLPQYPSVQPNPIFKAPATSTSLFGSNLPINPFSAVDDRITTTAEPSGINGSSTDDSKINPNLGWSI